jgi:KaiC/GvpD/RAD55 family RecA-like ATPase
MSSYAALGSSAASVRPAVLSDLTYPDVMAEPPGDLDQDGRTPVDRVRDRFGLLTRDQLGLLPPVEPLITDTLDRRSLIVLAGYWGTGKSFVSLDWACCVATAKPWQGRVVQPRAGRVLYIAGEGAFGLDDRITAWETAWHHQVADLDILPTSVDLMTDRDTLLIAELVEAQDHALVVFDTLSRCMAGADENAARDMSVAVRNLDRIRNAGSATTVVAVHHTGKDRSTVRGSSVLESAADTVYAIEGDGRTVELSRTKRKDGPRDDKHRLVLRGVDGTDSVILSAHSTASGSQDRVLSAYMSTYQGTGATKAELRKVAGLPSATFHRALSALVTDGTLVNQGSDKRPFYRHHEE